MQVTPNLLNEFAVLQNLFTNRTFLFLFILSQIKMSGVGMFFF